MSQHPEWSEELEAAKRELHDFGERERHIFADQSMGILRRLERLEAAVAELTSEREATTSPEPARRATEAVSHEPQLRPGRFARTHGSDHATDGGVPAGALAMAQRLANEGYSREEVSAFLDENFRRIDVPAAVAQAFDGAAVS
jgi:hypothetical protein